MVERPIPEKGIKTNLERKNFSGLLSPDWEGWSSGGDSSQQKELQTRSSNCQVSLMNLGPSVITTPKLGGP
jgi:hypothetical protein